METLRLVLLFVHILGFAALLGGMFVQLGPGDKKVNAAMRDGAGTAFLAGLALVGVLEAGDGDVNHAKIAAKATVGLVILVLVMANVRKPKPAGRAVLRDLRADRAQHRCSGLLVTRPPVTLSRRGSTPRRAAWPGWMAPSRSLIEVTAASAFRRSATISARIDTAISPGASAPMSSPIGACRAASACSVTSFASSHSRRRACVLREPIAPTYAVPAASVALIAGASSPSWWLVTTTASVDAERPGDLVEVRGHGRGPAQGAGHRQQRLGDGSVAHDQQSYVVAHGDQ